MSRRDRAYVVGWLMGTCLGIGLFGVFYLALRFLPW